MSSHPWLKFYPRDWRGDQALRAVSLAARGLWMECLCIMHEAKPYGHLLINGSPVGDDILARMIGVSVDEARALLDELRKAGVPSMRRDGVIFSRRMVADFGRSQKGRNSVNQRWSQEPEDEEENTSPNRSPITVPITQKADVRSQKPEEKNKKYSDEFEKFWSGFPSRPGMSKKKTAAEFARLDADERSLAISALPAFRAQLTQDRTEPRFIRHPDRWVRDRCFETFAEAAEKLRLVEAGFVVKRGSPQWEAWETFERAAGRDMHYSPRIDGWRFATEYPPQMQAAE